MKTLHLLRSRESRIHSWISFPDKIGKEDKLVNLYDKHTDYNHLIKDIFDCDKVISWW